MSALKNLETYNSIHPNILNQINKVILYPKYKSNDTKLPSNYRYIQNHSKSFKLIDKLWCMKLVPHIKKSDTTIFKCNIIS